MRPTSHHRSRGFTLIEMLVVVAIIGILVALAAWGFTYGTTRARMNNAAYETASMINVAKLRTAMTGHPNYVVFYQGDDGSFGVVHLERQETTGVTPPTWDDTGTGIDATDLNSWRASGNDLFLDRLDLSDTGGVRFQDLTTYRAEYAGGGTTLAPPFGSVDLTGAGSDGLLSGCNFCRAVNNGVAGVLRFTPDGLVTVPTAPARVGLAVGIGQEQQAPDAGSPPSRLLVIATPAGATRVF